MTTPYLIELERSSRTPALVCQPIGSILRLPDDDLDGGESCARFARACYGQRSDLESLGSGQSRPCARQRWRERISIVDTARLRCDDRVPGQAAHAALD